MFGLFVIDEENKFYKASDQVSLESVVFSLQSLDAAEVFAEVVRRQQDVLLVDPSDRFIGIAVEPGSTKKFKKKVLKFLPATVAQWIEHPPTKLINY